MGKTVTDYANDYVEGYNARDLDRVCEHLGEKTAISLAGGMLPFADLDAFRTHTTNEWHAFPDATFVITMIREFDGGGVVEGVWSGTLRNEMIVPGMEPLPPTGKRTDLPCAIVLEADDRGVTRLTGYWNSLIALSQLGLMPG
ncbi:MAG: nuclear transport factor 2 family protein [Actinomycetota bacterium]